MTAAMLQFVLLALSEAPSLVVSAESFIASLKGQASPEQNAAIDAALDAAHAKLQAAQPAPG